MINALLLVTLALGVSESTPLTVTVDTSPLSIPAGQVPVSLYRGASRSHANLRGAVKVSLADGAYEVKSYSTKITYGSFQVVAGVLKAPTGLVRLQRDVVTFDPATLTPVSFALSSLSSPPQAISLQLRDTQGVSHLQGRADVSVFLFDGRYEVTSWDGVTVFGSVTVEKGSITVSGPLLQRTAVGVGFDLTKLVPASFNLSRLRSPSARVDYAVSPAGPGRVDGYAKCDADATLWLPPGQFELRDSKQKATSFASLKVDGGVEVEGPFANVVTVPLIRCAQVTVSSRTGNDVGLEGLTSVVSGSFTIRLPKGDYTVLDKTGTAAVFKIDATGRGEVTAEDGGVTLTFAPCPPSL
jgi:hypothetical protein